MIESKNNSINVFGYENEQKYHFYLSRKKL